MDQTNSICFIRSTQVFVHIDNRDSAEGIDYFSMHGSREMVMLSD